MNSPRYYQDLDENLSPEAERMALFLHSLIGGCPYTTADQRAHNARDVISLRLEGKILVPGTVD